MDDLGAIIIIAAFCASSLSLLGLGAALFITAMLFGLNAFGVTRLEHYLMIGVMLWVAMLFSGIHATLAGVIVAMTIPLTAAETGGQRKFTALPARRQARTLSRLPCPACVWLCQCGRTACRRKRKHAVGAAVARHCGRFLLRQADRDHGFGFYCEPDGTGTIARGRIVAGDLRRGACSAALASR